MVPFSAVVRRGGAAALLVMTLANAGCAAWHVQGVPPESRLTTGHPGGVRVTRTDGSRITVDSTVVRADTLLGFVSGQPQVRMPLADVQQVETLGFSAGRTVGLLAGLALAVLAAFAIAIGSCTGACAS